MPAARIQWPDRSDEFTEYNDLIVTRHPLLTGAFASIDGLKLLCQTSDDPEIENATYNGWLSEHYINNVIVFAPSGEFTAVLDHTTVLKTLKVP
jgi:hypothetical protein